MTARRPTRRTDTDVGGGGRPTRNLRPPVFHKSEPSGRIGEVSGRSENGCADSIPAEPGRRRRRTARYKPTTGVGDESSPLGTGWHPLDSAYRQRRAVSVCRNTDLPFPDGTVDRVVSNNVPIDIKTWLGPGVQSSEVHRVLRSRGQWRHNGVIVYTKP